MFECFDNEPLTPEQVEKALDEFPRIEKARLRKKAHQIAARLRDEDVEAMAGEVYRRRKERQP